MSETVFWSTINTLWPVALAVIAGGLLERLRPWRRWNIDRLRWLHAAILFLSGTIISYIVVPLGHAGAALLATERGWGILNHPQVPDWAAIPIGVLVLDLTQWVCHWAMHRSPLLWRIHRLHHSDEVIDVSTAFRFHPAETLGRFLVQFGVILVLGVPVTAVAVAAVLVLAFDVWEHTNMETPSGLRRLSRIVITPDLHRIHHSSDLRHNNGNLGTIFIIWDRLFRTYVPDRELDDSVTFGLGPANRLSFRTLADLVFDPVRKD